MSKNIRVEELEDHVQHVIFDRSESPINVFDRDTMDELREHLDAFAEKREVKGVIFSSVKKSIFIAGADINELLTGDLEEDSLRDAVRFGQTVLQKIADLKVPTVAAIHGACMGGGLELALACSIRIASPARETKIGLPETSLGILPAWGGCYRLPRLIGLPGALAAILAGKRMAPKQALKAGLVDQLVPAEHLHRVALEWIGRRPPTRKSFKLFNNRLVARIIAVQQKSGILKKTRGHYPAVTRALEVVTTGISSSRTSAFKLEEDALVDLVRTEACQNLVRVFFLQERSKKIKAGDAKSSVGKYRVRRLAVVGAGTMGSGIAQWSAARGIQVVLRDIEEEALARGMANASKLFYQGTKRHIFTRTEAERGMDRIVPSADDVPLHHTDMVIEAAIEDIGIKRKIFAGLAERASERTILATNTSALSIDEIAEEVPSPERVIGIHFFNPVHRMALVEVVTGSKTSTEVANAALSYVQQIGKMPVLVKNSPGFLINRILMPYLIEAGHLFSGGADLQVIDESMLEFGMPMGPLRLIDEVGVDVSDHVTTFFADTFGSRMPVPGILKQMLKAGYQGRKSSAGFYLYKDRKKDPDINRAVQDMTGSSQWASLGREELRERMVLLMVNEAARCLEEEVVQAPEDVDFGMIMGTGFAPFRGGPLRYAESVGMSKIIAGLTHLADEVDPRFEPCNLIKELANSQRTFYND